MIRPLASFAAFFTTLALAAAGICALLPPPEVPVVSEKLAHLRAHRGDYNALFFGSSRIYRHIAPRLFDDAAREGGVEVRSFNFGVNAMFSPEDGFVFDEIAKSQPRGLRWVFIEVNVFRDRMDEIFRDSARGTYWHDAPRTALLARHYAAAGMVEKWRFKAGLPALIENGTAFFRRSVSLGRGAEITQRAFADPPRESRDHEAPTLGDAGYVPLVHPPEIAAEHFAEYQRTYRDRLAKPAKPEPLAAAGQANLDRILAAVRALGAQPILIIPPVTAAEKTTPARTVAAPLLDYCDLARHPALYDERVRIDSSHFNDAGAAIFTRQLAADFLRWLESTKTTP